MTSKVLIADDSLTIQKVINITLAQSDYDLQECLSEEDLLKKIETNTFDLILLDFNLSDNNSGYELAKIIKSKNPNAAILVMLGTFDTVDESKFKDYGISDKIIKPFESSKFIKKCSDVLENKPSADTVEFEDSLDEVESFDTDSWVMDAPKVEDNFELDFTNDDSNFEINDPLTSEMEGWGFSAESLESKYQKAFPPEINDEATSNIILSRLESSSLDLDFSDDLEIPNSSDETDPGYVLDSDSLENLSSSIEEELSADDFWAVDEIVETSSLDIDAIENNNVGEITQDININDYDLSEEISKEETPSLSFNANTVNTNAFNSNNSGSAVTIDEDAIVNRIKSELKPMIEEMIKEFYKQQAERVAWEVIPDLAENLIKKEIKSISDSVN